MPSFLVLAIILPLAGVLGMLGLSLVSRLRPYTHYVALGVIGLTAVLILTLRWAGPVEVVPSLWQPTLLFGVAPALQNDGAMQPLAFVLALAVFSAVLAMIGRAEEPRPRFLAASVVMLVAGFVALWAANPLAMIIGWACYDLLLAVGHIAAGDVERRATRVLVFGGMATLLLWGGALMTDLEGGSALWSLMTPTDAQMTLWMAAAVLRLWLYPFHFSAPGDLDATPASATLLMSPVVGWGLCLRLALVNGGSLPDSTWVPALAALALLLGSFLAWSCKSPRSALPWVGMGVNGAVLLAAWLVGEDAPAVIAAGSVVWALGMTVLFLDDGLWQGAPWWSVPALVGALAIAGVPLTLGFASQAALLKGIVRGGHLEWGGVFFLGNLFLIPSLVRWLLAPASSAAPEHRWRLVARGVGLGLPALLLIVAGFYPPLLGGVVSSPSLGALFAMPGLVGWLLWTVSLAGGGVLAWQDWNVRARLELLLSAAHDLLRLEWLYDAVMGAMDQGLGALRAADDVVGGAGSLLWSLVLFLLLLLILWGGG